MPPVVSPSLVKLFCRISNSLHLIELVLASHFSSQKVGGNDILFAGVDLCILELSALRYKITFFSREDNSYKFHPNKMKLAIHYPYEE